MATNYELLKTELQTLAAELSNAVAKYKCLALIDQYIAALEQQAVATATDVQSYSIGNRSVSRASADNYANTVARLENEINELLYGNVAYADFRVNTVEATIP